jgi:hypothetical protein
MKSLRVARAVEVFIYNHKAEARLLAHDFSRFHTWVPNSLCTHVLRIIRFFVVVLEQSGDRGQP